MDLKWADRKQTWVLCVFVKDCHASLGDSMLTTAHNEYQSADHTINRSTASSRGWALLCFRPPCLSLPLPPSLCVSLPLSACALHLYCRCLSCVRWCHVDLFSPRRSGCRPSRPLRAAAGSPPQLQLRSAGRATFVGVVFTHRFPIWRKSRACRGSLCAASISFLFLFCLLKSKLQVVPCKFTWLWYSRMECRVSWATSLSEDLKSWRAQVLIYICCAGLKERRLCVFRERSSFEGSPNEMIRQWVNTWRWDGDWETCEMLHVAAVSAGCL